ncbi:MAG: methyltransferase domain-containing protein [bacterium]|nr:methyltransferase domain-containing protein [bacterium]
MKGEVPNLEEHVKSDWWRYIFNSIYMKTDGDVVDDNRLTATEIDHFSTLLNINKDDHILDLCCGQGRHSLELSRRGFSNIVGFDRSHYLIQRARSRAKKENLVAKFREGDARKLPFSPDTFDVVMILGNSIGYFETMQDDMRVLKEVFRVLKPWGRILLDVADGGFLKNNYQPRSWEWISNNMFVCRERSLSIDGHRLVSREVVTHVDKGVIADQFYAERLYTDESMGKLLLAAGYTSFESHGTIIPDSQRNQDLGMMEKRMILTAQVKKEWSKSKSKKKDVRNVVVILGDPRKFDPLKPQSVFDDDDFYTIDQMKDALRGLPEYSFKFIDNHDTLIHDLTELKGKTDVVLNLCDEGFNNNPRLELHVPSLLEALNIPYSGAGPQCLAICYDKSLTRGLAKEMDIPVAEADIIRPEDTIMEIPFGFPVITKPNFGDSSFGITQRSIANNVKELENAIKEIKDKFGYDKPILVEEFLTGSDISVGIIGNPPDSYTVLPIIEEDYSLLPQDLPRLCGYEAKWLPDSPYFKITSIPAQLPEETEKFVIACCLRLYERLECRDYCRFDWRLDSEGNPKLLEVNPNPGWCWDGHLAKMAKIQGMGYKEMLTAILASVEQRYGLAQERATNGQHANPELVEVTNSL